MHAPSPAPNAPPTHPRKLRVAVVGSGLAGLTAAHLLANLYKDDGKGEEGVEVELFEKAHKLGMDAASLSVTCPCHKCAQAAGREDGDPDHEHVEGRMDVPMRSFFAVPEYYPNLVRLYRSIGVKFHDADNTLACFDVAFDNISNSTPSRTDTNITPASLEVAHVDVKAPYLSSRSYKVGSNHTMTLPDLPPLSLRNPRPFARRLLGYYRIARDYVKMLTVSKDFLTQGRMMEIGKDREEWGNGRLASLQEFLKHGQYSQDFADFFVPLFASVCTCSFERMMEFPACIVLEYVARCMPFGRMQFVSSGVQEVTENLSRDLQTVHYNTLVERIVEADPNGPDAGRLIVIDSKGVERTFDHIIFATQANQAAATLAGQNIQLLPRPYLAKENHPDLGKREEHDRVDAATPPGVEDVGKDHPFHEAISVLTKFPYERTQVVCHTDTAFLPKDPAHWRLLNIAKSTSADILASETANCHPWDEELGVAAETEKMAETSSSSPSACSKSSSTGVQSSLTSMRYRGGSQEAPTTTVAENNSSSSSDRALDEQTRGKRAIRLPISTASQTHNSAMATHIMNNTAPALGQTTKFLQTTNPIFPPRPETVISSAWFERAVVNPRSFKAVDELDQLMEDQAVRLAAAAAVAATAGVNDTLNHHPVKRASDRVWFVGSYAYTGIPLLEGCVVSALHAVERIVMAEPQLALAASIHADPNSFLARDEPMRWRRWKRRLEGQVHVKVAKKTGEDQERRTMEEDNRSHSVEQAEVRAMPPPSLSERYFQDAWKDAIEDEKAWQESMRDHHQHRPYEYEKKGAHGYVTPSTPPMTVMHRTKLWIEEARNGVYAQLVFMLALYIAAIIKWSLVIGLESLGFDGSRWALA
ncbi:hypothetical protein DFQ26_006772 [Actinomortierella ambigua]|nr:hypothetical protein DFQ26_006772 [Actinomortierella ambigua]